VQISVEEVSRLLSQPRHNRGRGSLTGARSGRNNADVDEIDALQTQRDVQLVRAAMNRLPDVREDRVQELRARIASGEYHVSSDEIADLIARRALADETAA